MESQKKGLGKQIEKILKKGTVKDAWGYEIVQGDFDGLKKELNKVFALQGDDGGEKNGN